MIDAQGLFVRAGAATLLDDVSVAVRPGELLAIVGPNGAGKSTLMRVLTGERRPDAGQVTLDGRPLADWSTVALARRRARQSQHVALDFGFTAFEVALLGRAPHVGVRESDHDHRVAWEALAAAGAEALAERAYPSLSGGEQQRVQLARALAQIADPSPEGARYLLLDEPTASLDLAHQYGTLSLARRLVRQGLGVVAVLHDLDHAAAWADRVLVLERGRRVALGTPAETLTPDLVREVFGVASVITEVAGAPRLITLPHA